jgi:hypothetical protein
MMGQGVSGVAPVFAGRVGGLPSEAERYQRSGKILEAARLPRLWKTATPVSADPWSDKA